MQEVIDFFLWLAVAVSLGYLFAFAVVPVTVFTAFFVLPIIQDAWAEAGWVFKRGKG